MPKKRQPKTPQPGSWRVRDHGHIIPSALRSVLTRGDALNECERDFLIELLKRLEDAKPATRSDLGITASRIDLEKRRRNDEAAAEYDHLIDSGIPAGRAETTVTSTYGYHVKDTINSRRARSAGHGRHNARLLAKFLNQRIKAPGATIPNITKILAGTRKK